MVFSCENKISPKNNPSAAFGVSYLTTPVSLIGGDKPLRQLAFVGLRFVKTTLSCFYLLAFNNAGLLSCEKML